VWDWGDSPSSCADCDPAAYAGLYDTDLSFVRVDTEVEVCGSSEEVELTPEGTFSLATGCNSSTGLEFGFEFDLYLHFNYEDADQSVALLAGSGAIGLPNGDVIEQAFYESSTGKYYGVVYLNPEVSQFIYWKLQVSWRLTIETPNGPLEYDVYLTVDK
jgi:hypothetical protein